MTLTIFLIAAIPAATVWGVGCYSRSRPAVVLAALVAVAVGFLGGPAYLVLDLIFVAVATYLAWESASPSSPPIPKGTALAQEKKRTEQRTAKEPKKISSVIENNFMTAAFVVGLILWLAWIFNSFNSSTPTSTPAPAPAPVKAPPTSFSTQQNKHFSGLYESGARENAAPTAELLPLENVVIWPAASEEAAPEDTVPAETCLKIPDPAMAIRCLERSRR